MKEGPKQTGICADETRTDCHEAGIKDGALEKMRCKEAVKYGTRTLLT